MDDKFSALFSAALKTNDRDEYISDWALSSEWGDAEDAEIPSQPISDLGGLWDVAHVTIRDLRAHTGLNRTAFALRYLIPYRTVENWERGDSQCPDYVRLLLAQATGYYRRPEV